MRLKVISIFTKGLHVMHRYSMYIHIIQSIMMKNQRCKNNLLTQKNHCGECVFLQSYRFNMYSFYDFFNFGIFSYYFFFIIPENTLLQILLFIKYSYCQTVHIYTYYTRWITGGRASWWRAESGRVERMGKIKSSSFFITYCLVCVII